MLDVITIQKLSGAKQEIAKLWLPLMQEYLPKYGITTKERISSFLSQVGHESGGLFYTEEIASGSAYEGRKNLGNTQSGDGVKFKGRGLIQTTGRSNYQDFKNKFGIDVISNPSLLGGKNALVSTPEQRKNALLAALYYWDKKKLNSLSDNLNLSFPSTHVANIDTVKKITKIINGGFNGLDDRLSRLERGRNHFVQDLVEVVKTVEEKQQQLNTYVKRNWLPVALITVGVVGLAVTTIMFINNKNALKAIKI